MELELSTDKSTSTTDIETNFERVSDYIDIIDNIKECSRKINQIAIFLTKDKNRLLRIIAGFIYLHSRSILGEEVKTSEIEYWLKSLNLTSEEKHAIKVMIEKLRKKIEEARDKGDRETLRKSIFQILEEMD